MKQYFIRCITGLFTLFITNMLYAQVIPPFNITPINGQEITLTTNKMTNLIFPMAVRSGIKVSKDVLAQKVKGVDNVIELKAVRKDFLPTNFSVFGMDGRLYSFDLRYDPSPVYYNFMVGGVLSVGANDFSNDSAIIQLTGLPVSESTLLKDSDTLCRCHFLVKVTRNERMKLILRGLFLKDGLLWVEIQLKNQSAIPYPIEYAHLYTALRKKVKRTAQQRIFLSPVFEPTYGPVPAHGKETLAIGFIPFTLVRDKKVILEISESNGGRLLDLDISHRLLLKTKQFKSLELSCYRSFQ